MKIRFTKTLSILCAVMLTISAVSAWAAAEEESITVPAMEYEINGVETVPAMSVAEAENAETEKEPEGDPEGPSAEEAEETIPGQSSEGEPEQDPEGESEETPEGEEENIPEQPAEEEPESDPEQESEEEPEGQPSEKESEEGEEEEPSDSEEEPEEPEEDPEREPEEESEKESEEETEEETVGSIEILITKSLTPGHYWEGTVSKTKPAVLKLDVKRAGTVYIVLEGKDAWIAVEKSDRLTGDAAHNKADPDTGILVYELKAEAGSYIITVGPVEPNPMAMARVTFMTASEYEDWADEREEDPEQEGTEPEEDSEPEEDADPSEDKEPEEGTEPEGDEPEERTEPEEKSEPEEGSEQKEDAEPSEDDEPEEGSEPEEAGEPEEESELQEGTEPEEGSESEEESEGEQSEENGPESEEELHQADNIENRFVVVNLKWDVVYPIIGDTAHLSAVLNGYEGLEYTVQWQSSPDREIWDDVPDANDLMLDVVITEDNNHYYWRLVVYLEEGQEE